MLSKMKKNFTAARLRLCRDPDTENPVIFYSQELNRNFKNPNDQFGKRHLLKTFTPSNALASADIALEHKFTDTILAHRKKIDDYSPLTDIHSNEMNLFIDDDTATYLSDVGVNVDGFGEDFQEMETVNATPFMEEVAIDAGRLKAELGYLRKELRLVKGKMAEEMNEEIDLLSMSEDKFNKILAMHRISDALVQRYLALLDKIRNIEAQTGAGLRDGLFRNQNKNQDYPQDWNFSLHCKAYA